MPTTVPEAELSEAEAAELYRLGLMSGYFSVGNVVRWAEARVGTNYDSSLLDLSLASRQSIAEVSVMLGEFSSGADTAGRAADVAGLIRRAVASGRWEASEAVAAIARLAGASGEESLQTLSSGWEDLPYLRMASGGPGYGVTASEVERDLADYAPRSPRSRT